MGLRTKDRSPVSNGPSLRNISTSRTKGSHSEDQGEDHNLGQEVVSPTNILLSSNGDRRLYVETGDTTRGDQTVDVRSTQNKHLQEEQSRLLPEINPLLCHLCRICSPIPRPYSDLYLFSRP